MKTYIQWMKRAVFLLVFLGATTACEIDEVTNPNAPDIDITKNPALSDLLNIVSGTEAGMRNRLGTYYDGVGVIGREYWRFSSSDPRFTTDLLGKGTSTLDNNTFYTTGPYAERYRVVKNANLLIEGVNNTSASISTDDKNFFIAFAKTIQAHELLLVLNQQYTNGIRTSVADPDNLGAFEGKDAALTSIATLLDDAGTLLAGKTGALPFTLSDGYSGFSDVPGFYQFNRALAARVAVYRGNYSDALTHLGNSFYDLNGSLNSGVFYPFSIAGGDELNPLFLTSNASEIRLVHPSFITDAEAGDTRVTSKTNFRGSTNLDGGTLTGDYDFALYPSNTDFMPIIRNEELILIYAEASIQEGQTANALTALNTIRNAAGLANYSGATDTNSLIDEMLKQRRYSLFGEGHRWIDMRRYSKLGELPIDRTDDDVWTEFPRPASED